MASAFLDKAMTGSGLSLFSVHHQHQLETVETSASRSANFLVPCTRVSCSNRETRLESHQDRAESPPRERRKRVRGEPVRLVLLSKQRHAAYTLLFVRGREKRSHEGGFSNLVGKVWLCYVALTSETRYRCVAISND